MNSVARICAAAVGAIVLAGATGASADIVAVTQTLDLLTPKTLSGPGLEGWQGAPAFSGGLSFDLAEGDTLDYSIDFLGGQSLTLSNATSLWAFVYAQTSSDVTGTGTLTLLDQNGGSVLTSNFKTDTQGSIHFGQNFTSGDFTGGLPASLTFFGLHYVGVVDDYVEQGVTTRHYEGPAFYFETRSATVNPGGVPEPETWALMIGGFGLAGGALRRRRALAA